MPAKRSMSHSEFPLLHLPTNLFVVFLITPYERYPSDIPQGTAIPQWAFFNVTVRNLHYPENCALTFCVDVG